MVGSTGGPSKHERFDLDVSAEREGIALRVGGACVALLASLWLLTLPYPMLRVLVVAGFGFAIMWLRAAARARARVRSEADQYLDLGPDALRLAEGDRVQILPWTEVVSVSVDEDRLCVSVARKNGAPLEIEPRYTREGSVGLHDLARAVQAARLRACPGPESDTQIPQPGSSAARFHD